MLDESKVGHLFFLYRIVRSRIDKLASFETLVEHTIDGGFSCITWNGSSDCRSI